MYPGNDVGQNVPSMIAEYESDQELQQTVGQHGHWCVQGVVE